MDFKKKLHLRFPSPATQLIDTQRTKEIRRPEPADPLSIERVVRQLLCNKISGNLLGIWLLIPEHLRLGTWDLLKRWTGEDNAQAEPRIALQMVHEAALCLNGQRQKRSLSQQGFEVANGLPFVASDLAVHDLLDAHTVAEAQGVQLMLAKIRHALGHYPGRILAIDPHRIPSYSKRQMVRRKKDPRASATKQIQTFFAFDADSQQPICFTLGSSSRNVSRATLELLDMAAEIFLPDQDRPLVLADTEHYTLELLDTIRRRLPFHLLVPMSLRKRTLSEFQSIPAESFTRHWIGYATYGRPYRPKNSQADPYWQIIQRKGECEQDYKMNAFLCTTSTPLTDQPLQEYPKRWHCEEFFNANQALGWNRAGTQNLNIRYAQMTMALIAQTVISMLRQSLGQPFASWDAKHFAQDFFRGLEGDIRLHNDTIIVTYYNAPNADQLSQHYTRLPEKLQEHNTDPRIPWLYGYKLDFRFK